MKSREKKPETIFRIINRETGEVVGSYSRACCNEYDFESVEHARGANCHGIFEDKEKYRIAQYKVTYELIDKCCDDEKTTIIMRAKGIYSPNCPECGCENSMIINNKVIIPKNEVDLKCTTCRYIAKAGTYKIKFI